MIILLVWPSLQPSVSTEEFKRSLEEYCGGEWMICNTTSPEVADNPAAHAIGWFYSNGLHESDDPGVIGSRVAFYCTKDTWRAIWDEVKIGAPWARTFDIKWHEPRPVGASVARAIVWEFCEDNAHDGTAGMR